VSVPVKQPCESAANLGEVSGQQQLPGESSENKGLCEEELVAAVPKPQDT